MKCEATDLSQRWACRLAGLSLSTWRYEVQRPAADAYLSGRITQLSAGVSVTAVYGSNCDEKACMLITSACTAFIISAAQELSADDVVKEWQQNVFHCS